MEVRFPRLLRLQEGTGALSRTSDIAIFVTEAFYERSKLYGVSGHVQIPLKAACLMAERLGRFDFITTKPAGAEHLMVEVPSGLEVAILPHATKEWPQSGVYRSKALIQLFRFWQLLRKRRYRVVHLFGGPKTGLLAGVLKILTPRIRVIYSPLSAPSLPQRPLSARLSRGLLSRLDLVVGTTEHVSSAWIEVVGEERVDVVRPGVLKNMAVQSPERRNAVVFWRNADFENGADLMIEAVESLAPLHPDVEFVFALRSGSEFESRAIELAGKVHNVVTYVQPYPDGLTIERILSRALLVVAPFRQLSINPQMCLLETLDAGVPLVASDIESNREVVLDGVTGLLVESGRSDLIVEAVDKLLADRALLEELTNNAKGGNKAFNWSDFEAGLARIYGV